MPNRKIIMHLKLDTYTVYFSVCVRERETQQEEWFVLFKRNSWFWLLEEKDWIFQDNTIFNSY